MNMLPPMNENAYQDHVQAACDAAECTAKKSMSKVADKVKEFYEADEEGIYNIAVSGIIKVVPNNIPIFHKWSD